MEELLLKLLLFCKIHLWVYFYFSN